MRIAFKEWAIVVDALGRGEQIIILRKGGIAEAGGVFRVEHDRFWLYPTYAHQQQAGVTEEARPLLARVVGAAAPGGVPCGGCAVPASVEVARRARLRQALGAPATRVSVEVRAAVTVELRP